ncbi:MAG: hypothetical protein PSW75_11065 [bacterium]|nr:hypothetical protein [bacterium]
MSVPDLFQKITAFLRRRWADVLASDLAAGSEFEPELPATAFVQPAGSAPAHIVQASGLAERQRSARISISSG